MSDSPNFGWNYFSWEVMKLRIQFSYIKDFSLRVPFPCPFDCMLKKKTTQNRLTNIMYSLSSAKNDDYYCSLLSQMVHREQHNLR